MIIVSQDKKRIVENLNLGIREAGEYNQNYVIYNTEIGEDLGEYKTEERAIEVLQEIIITIRGKNMAQFSNGEMKEVYQIKNDVYEMPKE